MGVREVLRLLACSTPSSAGPGEADLPPGYDEALSMTLLSPRSRTRPVYYHLGRPVLPLGGREHEEQVYFPDVPPPESLRPPSSVVGQTTTTPAPISGLRQLILLIITLFVRIFMLDGTVKVDAFILKNGSQRFC